MLPTIVTGDAPERRRRPRVRLACPVRMLRIGNGCRIDTKTEDISCEGFFCITESLFSLREKLYCELVIATGSDGRAVGEAIVLRCRAEVVRVVRQPENSAFGVGCRVSDYTIERTFIERHLPSEGQL